MDQSEQNSVYNIIQDENLLQEGGVQNRGERLIRLQAFLAHGGAASRRASERLITEGRVTVNGAVAAVLGTKVRSSDDVRLDGFPVRAESRFLYLALHKPPGYLCSSSDPQGRPLALSLLPPVPERLYNVGRLDFQSSGLIIFTNDGDFAARLGHPGSAVEKEYLVEATGPIPDKMLLEFSQGISIDGVRYKCSSIERLDRKSVRVVLIEGKNREIRRVFSHFHLHPAKLRRIRIGPVPLGDLAAGQCRLLTEKELELLS